MSSLPEPSFIDRDPVGITAEMVAQYEAMTGKTLYPAQVERVLVDLIAYRESLVRIAIQEAAKQNLVTYARYPMLDYLGELVGVARLAARPSRCEMTITLAAPLGVATTIPAGVRVASKDDAMIFITEAAVTIAAGATTGVVWAACETAGAAGNGYGTGEINRVLAPLPNMASVVNLGVSMGGADLETDDRLRERVMLAPESFSVAGSRGAYRFWALTAHQSIVDVAVLSPTPGVVDLYPLTSAGEPDQAVLDAVLATCSDERVRPLTDQVFAMAPVRHGFTIAADITLYATADQATVEQQVTGALTAWTAGLGGALGKDATTSRIIAVINSIAGVYKTVLTAPVADVVCAGHEWANCESITISVAGVVNG